MNFGRLRYGILLLSALALAACKTGNQPAANQTGEAGAQPGVGATANAGAAAQPSALVTTDLPAGTRIRVRLEQDLGSKISDPGENFVATVADDVVVRGHVLIAQGARADGTVVDARSLGHFEGGALLDIRLERVHPQWGSYPVSTSSIEKAEPGKGKHSAEFIGGEAAVAGAGTAGAGLTGKQQIVLPAESLLTFRLEKPVPLVEQQ